MSSARPPHVVERALREAKSFEALLASLKAEFDDQIMGVRKALAEAREEFENIRTETAGAEAHRAQAMAEASAARGLATRRFGEEYAAALASFDERQRVFEALVNERAKAFPLIADAWADYDRARALALAEVLEKKERPALVAAQVLRDWGKEMSALRRELKVSEWIVKLYEWHFPWLEELRDAEEEGDFIADVAEADSAAAGEEGADPARRWLTAEEFRALPSAERHQRALDRYLRSRKSRWQLGRDYERYVGYLREQAGCRVTYHGIFKGLEDLGRDLLAERDGTLEVIQCKRWARSKVIHEKHIFQLFGTMVATRIENPIKVVSGTFVTTTSLSDRARAFAEALEIEVEENFPLADYPRIKCNVARESGERIYHLPFDQQYDSTLIEPERGECFVATVAEAEALGFRRAWRWQRPAV